MKFTVETKAFRSAIDAVKYATGSKVKEALRGIYCEMTHRGELVLQATDLEVGIVYRMAIDGSMEPGACILPAEQMAKLLREATSEFIDFHLRDTMLHVYAGDLKCELTTLAAAEFPQVEIPQGGQAYTMPMAALLDGFGKVGFAVGTGTPRFAIAGVHIDVQDDSSCKMVATDTTQVVTCRYQPDTIAYTQPFEAIVPPRAFKLLQAVSGQGGIVGIAKVKNDMLFTTESVSVSARTIERRFPPYEQIIPKRHSTTAVIDADDFAAALRAVAVTSDTGRVELNFDDSVLRLESSSPSGRATTQTACTLKGPSVHVRLAIDKLLPFLGTCKGQQLAVKLIDNTKPVVIVPDDGRTFLVMTMDD